MRVWRLALGRYREIDGEGARLFGGRWNNPGIQVVYAATHVSLALLEQLVHLNPARLPPGLRAFAIEIPEAAGIEIASGSALPDDTEACRRFGDKWARSSRSAALIVPSAVVPATLDPAAIRTAERNVVLNPRHPSAPAWQVIETAFRVDDRLHRTAGFPPA